MEPRMAREITVRSVRRLLGASVVIVAALLLVSVFTAQILGGRLRFTDGKDVLSAAAAETLARTTWSEPSRLPAPINTGGMESSPSAFDGGQRLVFTVGCAGANSDLYVARRTPAGFTTPEPLVAVNSPADDTDPCVSADGTLLVFASNRRGGRGGFDLWASEREGDDFGPPRLLGAVNSAADDREPALDAAASLLVFASDRGARPGSHDLLASYRSGADFGEPRVIAGCATAADERDPALSACGRVLFFASDAEGGAGGFDLRRSVRYGETWLPPRIVEETAGPGDERGPALSAGGSELLFEAGGDLWAARRVDWLPSDLPVEMPLRALLSILLTLLATLLLLYLLFRWKDLHPFVKFLLLSLLAHLLFALYLNSVDLGLGRRGEGGAARAFRVRFLPSPSPGTDPAALAARGGRIEAPRSPVDPRVERQHAPRERDPAEYREGRVSPAVRAAVDAPLERGEAPVRRQAPAPAEDRIEAEPDEIARRSGSEPAPRGPETPVAAGTGRAGSPAPSGRIADGGGAAPVPADRTPAVAAGAVRRTEAGTPGDAVSVPGPAPVARTDARAPAPRVRGDETAPPDRKEGGGEQRSEAAPADVASQRIATSKGGAVAGFTGRDGSAAPDEAGPAAPIPEPGGGMALRRSVAAGDPIAATDAVIPVRTDRAPSPSISGGEAAAAGIGERRTGRDADVAGVVPGAPASPDRMPVAAPEAGGAGGGGSAAAAPAAVPPDAAGVLPRRRAEGPPDRSTAGVPRSTDAGPPDLLAGVSAPAHGGSDLSPAPVADREAPGGFVPRLTAAGRRDGRIEGTPGGPRPLPWREADVEARSLIVRRRPAPASAPEERPAAEILSRRTGSLRSDAVARFGGSEATEQAVARGLRYLASIQQRRGHWGSLRTTDAKYGHVAVGKTGLALLAFLASGHTSRSATEYSDVVDRAIRWLLAEQDAEGGHFGDSEAYGHGIATYALAEALAMTGEERLREPVARAVARIERAQVRSGRNVRLRGGWSYYYPDEQRRFDAWPRASVTVWQVMALKAAGIAGISVSPEVLAAARSYLLNSFDEELGAFRYSHDPARLRSSWATLPGSTPASLFALRLLGAPKDDPRFEAAVEFIRGRLPGTRWRRPEDDAFVERAEGNEYFWYYATLALFQWGGEPWAEWNDRMSRLLITAQTEDGSWSPISPYAGYAGDTREDRAYTTAIAVLILEVYYRYFTPLLREGAASAEAPAADALPEAAAGGGGICVVVAVVDETSAAWADGLRAGDILLSFNGRELRNLADLERELAVSRRARRIPVSVERDGRVMRLTLSRGLRGVDVRDVPR